MRLSPHVCIHLEGFGELTTPDSEQAFLAANLVHMRLKTSPKAIYIQGPHAQDLAHESPSHHKS